MDKICNNCKEVFDALSFDDKFCSAKCRNVFYKECKETNNRLSHSINCAICDEAFETRYQHSKYCSAKCKKYAARENYNKTKEITDFIIYNRDGFKCVYCGKSSIIDGVKLNVEHILPRKHIYLNNPINLVTACEDCNNSKLYKLLDKDVVEQLYSRNKTLNTEFDVYDCEDLVQRLNSKYPDITESSKRF